MIIKLMDWIQYDSSKQTTQLVSSTYGWLLECLNRLIFLATFLYESAVDFMLFPFSDMYYLLIFRYLYQMFNNVCY